MTDFDKVKLLLEYLKIHFETCTYDSGTVYIIVGVPDEESPVDKVQGYSGFYCGWHFDTSGKFVCISLGE